MLPSRALLITSLFLSLASNSTHAQEQSARLVRDLNRNIGNFSADIRWVTSFGKGAVFAMDTPDHGSEPWITDGTAKGTRLLKDLRSGAAGSRPDQPLLFANGTRAAFRAERGTSGHEVWVTDGTEAGTVQVSTAPAPGTTTELRIEAGTTGGIFFEKEDTSDEDATELVFSDGTAAGTWTLNPIDGETQARFSNPFAYATSGQWCYFFANEDEVWRSDGTEAGTTKVLTLTNGLASRLAPAGGKLFVEIAADYRFTHTTLHACPMEGGTLTQLTFPVQSGKTWLEHPLIVGNELYLTRTSDGSFGVELWATDGTPAGTRKITLPAGQDFESAVPGSLTSWKGAIYLTTERLDKTHTLWRSDGTSTGTTPVTSVTASNFYFKSLTATADYLYFLRPGGLGDSLWRTQGDAATTQRVKGVADSYEPSLAAAPSGLIFTSERSTSNEALCLIPGKKTKGTPLTKPLKGTDSAIQLWQSDVSPYEMAGGNIVSLVDTGSGREVWSITPDGSRARSLWKMKSPDMFYWDFIFLGTTPTGAMFNYYDGRSSSWLMSTDGTSRGTKRLPGYAWDFVKLGDLGFYPVIANDHSQSRLWKTDGTPAGTSRIEATASETNIPAPDYGQLVVFQNHVYFLSTLNGKTTLWRTDGTADSTVPLMERSNEEPGDGAHGLCVADGKLLFHMITTRQEELWESDGTTAGTKPTNPSVTFWPRSISGIFDLGDAALFFAKKIDEPNYRWWRHDATGTLPMPTDPIVPFPHYEEYGSPGLAILEGKLLYNGDVETGGYELWTTDGTAAGTYRLKDIQPGEKGSSPSSMLTIGDKTYFTADDGIHGRELWCTDGTEAGTVLAADIDPGPYGSDPKGLKLMDGKLYFSAHRRDVGRELFVVDLPTG